MVVQLLLLFSICTLVVAPILLGVNILRYLTRRTHKRDLIVTACFHAGVLCTGWAVWATRPSGWKLPFWTTVKAGGDSETYGHVIEHAAEVLIANVILVGLIGGLIATGMALLLTRRLRRTDSTSHAAS
jgi:hypothetical protein